MNISQTLFCRAALVAVLSILSASSHSAPGPIALPDDASWYRKQLIDGEVKPRLQYGMAANGFYRPNLARDWRPLREQRGTLITQTRAIYVMTAGYEVTGEQVYYDAMIKAADFLLEHFADKKAPGRWVRAVGADGKVLDASFHAYGYAHVIFALAHAYHESKNTKYRDAALATWLQLDLPRTLQGRNPDLQLRGLNVAMHAFEGLLVLYKTDRSNLVRGDLNLLGDYILTHFFDAQGGFFYEELDANLRPAPSNAITLGHNAEIAFLFSRVVDLGFPKKYLDAANRAIDFVVKRGINRADGSMPHELNYDGTVKDPTLIWWVHTELLRALAHFVVHRDRQDLHPALLRTMAYAKLHFIDPVYGGWYEQPDGVDRPKGRDWMAGYHVAMMLTEMLRLQGTAFKSGTEMLL
jgi:mannose/cellobiose epimerase-like protein (N-acyl-D-glucosamine 2-epimerase family)